MKLEEITAGTLIQGVEPDQAVTVVSISSLGSESINVIYRTQDNQLRERMLFRSDESQIQISQSGRPWAFDAPTDSFKLATEALRINLAYLFDSMMAVHTSNVEPLPHQISAVYESMLLKQPLRFVLADDPGAGKTIMAGLLIQELLLRADARRVLIVAPGSLVEQWQEEMDSKFGLFFSIFSREQDALSQRGNYFEEKDLLIARLDQLARNEDLKDKLAQTSWDLVVFDEAHKLAAHFEGSDVKKTDRFKLGELLGSRTRHLLLMTATPHNGKEEDFQLFLSLLDSDRFYGKFRDGVHKVDVTDLMRRMVKEELLKFDGTRLFPERKASTTNYHLSDREAALYHDVTNYVKNEFEKANDLEKGRKNSVGFALTSLQRRLASSPEAIFQSLKRRREKLARILENLKLQTRGELLSTVNGAFRDEEEEPKEDQSSGEYEAWEEEVTSQVTASEKIEDLEAEIVTLKKLESAAAEIVRSGEDRKWEELSKLLQNTPEMKDDRKRQRKLIIFTEYKDTLNYLKIRIEDVLGRPGAVVTIHGGIHREERHKIQELFRNDPDVRILVATDAAGEGVNLQNAHLMVNYDLPWNPNRLEQRFGRIHRIGQTEVCHLWNLVASETREGAVFQRLFDKLEVEREALGGRVFDVLGEIFEEKSLRDLLIEAIRYGENPEVQAKLFEKVEGALDTAHLKEILQRNALSEKVLRVEDLFTIREEMEKAEAKKLQPYFIRSFFMKAFRHYGGDPRLRETGRFEIPHVPAKIRDRDRLIAGRDHRYPMPVLKKYERVTFEREFIRLSTKTDAPMAALLHPGHPLMQAMTDLILEEFRDTLKRGTVFFDPTDPEKTPRLLLILDHAVREGANPDRVASRRLQFVEMTPDGAIQNAGAAPHLDLEPFPEASLEKVKGILEKAWLGSICEQKALEFASTHLVPEHFTEIRARREASVDKTLSAVHERLTKEIAFWDDRLVKTMDDQAAGKDVRLKINDIRQRIDDLRSRLDSRTVELKRARNLISAAPLVIGGAVVIPAGLLEEESGNPVFVGDAESRSRIERLAMAAVMHAEKTLGHEVRDVSAQKCGWDITSIPPSRDGRIPEPRHIEVKGRVKGQTTITVTKNEIITALNQSDKFLLAIVLVDGDRCEGPFYVKTPFTQEPDWAEVGKNLDLKELLKKATSPIDLEQR
jgi:superfamily II DNA or RNA helicase